MVEFAIMAPLLILLLLGIIEFGWLFAQNVDVRHGAREGARLAATNFAGDIGLETCNRMDLTGTSTVTVNLTRTGTQIGSTVTVTVTAVPSSITGAFAGLMPASLSSAIESRIEQPATWTTGTTTC